MALSPRPARLRDYNLFFFDAETGGLNPIEADMVEVACVLTDPTGETVLDEYCAKVLPKKPVHPRAAAVNGYSAEKWAGEGRQYFVFFQDTNSLCFKVTQAAIGVSIEHSFEVNSVTVPRKAKDAVGAITKLVRADGTSITVNVEYNQLEPLLK